MSSHPPISPPSQMTGAQAVIAALMHHGINTGFGIPSIHNIPIYEVLRQTPAFQHWIVRHEQAAGFAADGYYRRSGKIAVVFASTGPGNLFTLVPLLESLQTQTPLLLIGSNISTSLLAKTGGALHETPEQLEIIKPLTRFARRVNSPDEFISTIDQAMAALRGTMPGPAFIEIPQDLFHAPMNVNFSGAGSSTQPIQASSGKEIKEAILSIGASQKPVILVGAGAVNAVAEIQHLAEQLQSPVFTTTSGKGNFSADHPLSLGCISRLGPVQEVLAESDLLISFSARLIEFDTGRFNLKLPPKHIQVVEDRNYPGNRIPSKVIVGEIAALAKAFAKKAQPGEGWCNIAEINAREAERLEALGQGSYLTLKLLRTLLTRNDVVVNDQSILNYWASAFFPALTPKTFLYPLGSGTLGYGLPAAIGAACAMRQSGDNHRIICIAGDGGFQYTQHELATLAQYELAVKILLVNDNAYGVIGFLQRSMFGQTHEVALKNPDFCRVAEAYGITAMCATSFAELKEKMLGWLNTPGPALLEWRTQLKAPWEVGAIPRPTGIAPKSS